MKKLLLAINHCHSNNIVHRDLKPENIMFANPPLTKSTGNVEEDLGPSPDIKIIDFGLGKVYNKNRDIPLTAVVGTSYYVAPEVLDGRYGFECDCWSLGVIMFVMLSGHLPFSGRSNSIVFHKIRNTSVKFVHKEFAKVSDQAKELIVRLLDRDPKRRYTCSQALAHPWFN